MACNLLLMVPKLRIEEHSRTAFEGASTTAYVEIWESEDNAKKVWRIYHAGAPGTSFTDAPVDSLYCDTTNHIWYTKQDAADTWAAMNS